MHSQGNRPVWYRAGAHCFYAVERGKLAALLLWLDPKEHPPVEKAHVAIPEPGWWFPPADDPRPQRLGFPGDLAPDLAPEHVQRVLEVALDDADGALDCHFNGYGGMR